MRSRPGGRSRPILASIFVTFHATLYRLSGGRLLGRAGGMPFLLLTTNGRRSGRPRSTPVTYLEDEGRHIVAASNSGRPRHPAWYLNLQHDANARVQIRARRFAATARTATGEERARLWARFKAAYPRFARYEDKTNREIPVVILEQGR